MLLGFERGDGSLSIKEMTPYRRTIVDISIPYETDNLP